MFRWLRKRKFKSICIVGMDGTGKSSIVNSIKERLQMEHNVRIQYMGCRNWEMSFLKDDRNSAIQRLLLPFEMYYRIEKYNNYYDLLVFDRYIDEQLITLKVNGTYKDWILYCYYFIMYLPFRKPDLNIYLCCDVETSISRKNDITSEQVSHFKEVKKNMDLHYNNKKNTLVLKTDEISLEEEFQLIFSELKKRNIVQSHCL